MDHVYQSILEILDEVLMSQQIQAQIISDSNLFAVRETEYLRHSFGVHLIDDGCVGISDQMSKCALVICGKTQHSFLAFFEVGKKGSSEEF